MRPAGPELKTHDLNDNLTRQEASISYITICLLPHKEHSVLPLERSSIALLSVGICITLFLNVELVVHILTTKLPVVNNNYYVFYLFAYCVLKRGLIYEY